ncbi:hypothetical protein CYY_007408 [Polysphondylium violaceum]|uniref:Myb transcription factor n=1 Tax=Polysphondylium violaceum TaxID=133409 RepID=A0A8J4PQV1_9MYCE|nr:hypothetical protein CYY_007408 [Polysphondylium violaceum]
MGFPGYYGQNNYMVQTVPGSDYDLLFEQQHQQYIYQQQMQQQIIHPGNSIYIANEQQIPNNQNIQYIQSPQNYSQQYQQQQIQQQQQQPIYIDNINCKKRPLESSSNSIDYGYYALSPSNSFYQTPQMNMLPISHPDSPLSSSGSPSVCSGNNSQSNEILDEDIEDQIKEYLLPAISHIMEFTISKEHILNILSDFNAEEISLRNVLSEFRDLSLDEQSCGGCPNLLNYIVDLLLVMDTNNKMVTYLKDHGLEDNELSIDTKKFNSLSNDFENGLKKRDKSKKAGSRGLRNPPNKWTKEESQKLIQLVHENGDKQWKKIALQIGGGKTGAQCAQHWKRVLCPAIRKGSWDEEEEAKLFLLVEKHGQSWKNVACEIRTRTDIQCRYQYFKSCQSREVGWSAKEDELLQKKVIECKQEGREISWMDLSKSMARARQTKIPRTALECKIRWENISCGSIIDGLHDNITSSF